MNNASSISSVNRAIAENDFLNNNSVKSRHMYELYLQKDIDGRPTQSRTIGDKVTIAEPVPRALVATYRANFSRKMTSIKKYFQKQFRLSMFNVEHDDLSDFYLSAFQGSHSPLSLMCLRTFLFLGCVAIILATIIMSIQWISFGHWLTYLTHWGVILIVITSGSGALVSLKAYLEDTPDASSSLVLFTKIYWVLYNISIPIAFTITIFYWSFLTQLDEEFAINPVLDVFIHAVNSAVMLVLVVFSRQPSRLLHFYHSLAFAIVYLLFSVIYYLAGGLSPFGDVYIYPMLDWSKPGEAMVTVVGTAFLLIVAHTIIVFLSLGRNKLGKRLFINNSVDIYYN